MLVVVGGFDGDQDLESVEVCLPSESPPSWALASGGMKSVRSAVGAAAVGSRIYVAGGSSGSAAHCTVESFTISRPGDADPPATSSGARRCAWRDEAPLATARMAASLSATADGTLWAAGGYTHERSALHEVERREPDGGDWLPAPSLRTARCSFGQAVLGGAVVAVGGFGMEAALRECELLDARTAVWQALPPMRQRRSCLAAARLGSDRLLVCGGHDGARALAEAEIFDQRAGKWEALPPMPTARSGPAAAAAEGKAWVVGGYPDGTAACSAAQALRVVEAWDEAARRWTVEADLQCGRTGAGGVVLAL